MIIFELAYEFFKIGLFAVGGGAATIQFLFQLGETSGWFSAQSLTDMISVSECTPGAIGVNMATYVGYDTAGVLGGIVAALSLIAPAFFIASIISKFLVKFEQSVLVKDVFYGLRPASVALIATGCFEIAKTSILNFENIGWEIIDTNAVIFAAVLYILMKELKLHPIYYLGFAALMGILLEM